MGGRGADQLPPWPRKGAWLGTGRPAGRVSATGDRVGDGFWQTRPGRRPGGDGYRPASAQRITGGQRAYDRRPPGIWRSGRCGLYVCNVSVFRCRFGPVAPRAHGQGRHRRCFAYARRDDPRQQPTHSLRGQGRPGPCGGLAETGRTAGCQRTLRRAGGGNSECPVSVHDGGLFPYFRDRRSRHCGGLWEPFPAGEIRGSARHRGFRSVGDSA